MSLFKCFLFKRLYTHCNQNNSNKAYLKSCFCFSFQLCQLIYHKYIKGYTKVIRIDVISFITVLLLWSSHKNHNTYLRIEESGHPETVRSSLEQPRWKLLVSLNQLCEPKSERSRFPRNLKDVYTKKKKMNTILEQRRNLTLWLAHFLCLKEGS